MWFLEKEMKKSQVVYRGGEEIYNLLTGEEQGRGKEKVELFIERVKKKREGKVIY